ncbi:MAG: hypothetical protein BMS9Abin31_0211 [Gammaproteobacteria bacterium]|nr:MAG: hypothetical protein BMS9Abin31_0211 [Gammaproteobacteria bacterium]
MTIAAKDLKNGISGLKRIKDFNAKAMPERAEQVKVILTKRAAVH